MLAGDAAPPAIGNVHVTTCSTCGGTMHNKQRYRIAHDGFGNAMYVADMDEAIPKGHLILEINSITTINPLPCSMDEYNSMRKESKFSTITFVAIQKYLLDSTSTSLETMLQVEQNLGNIADLNEDDNVNAMHEDDCNSGFITQDTLDDLPFMQEKFWFEKLRH
eukprot:8099130-Ditylum_brightwellii.AAC.1